MYCIGFKNLRYFLENLTVEALKNCVLNIFEL